MKCPKCKGEMEEGITIDGYGDVGIFGQQNSWAKGIEKKWKFFQGKNINERKISTFRCTNCGFLESYAK